MNKNAIRRRRRGSGGSLSGVLFSASEPGFTFEPWDITTLFQDRAGTTPVTAAGQSVGLRLDKSQGLRQGPELVTNGTFDTGIVGWTVTNVVWSAGAASFTGAPSLSQNMTTTSGVTYRVTVSISGLTGGSLWLRFIGGTASNTPLFSNGTTTFLLKSNGNTALLIEQASGAITAGSIDNISVRELAGNHEVAVSDAKRGIYGWMPKTGRRNLLTYTEQFDNAAWTVRQATISANAVSAPDGTLTADTFVENAATATHDFYYSVGNALSAGTHTASVYVKSRGRNFVRFQADAAGLTGGATFNLSDGTSSAVTAGYTASAVLGVSGFWKLTLTKTFSASTVYFSLASSDGASISIAGLNAAAFDVWGAQLEVGSTATAYQRVVSQYDITEAGVQTCYYVQADGVDDAYVTPTITPNTDKAQVFAGVRRNIDVAGAIIEFGSGVNVYAGSVALFTGTNSATALGNGFQVGSRGSVFSAGVFGVSPTLTPPVSAVLTGLTDIAADSSVLRGNGVAGTPGTADQGTGNYLAYPAYIYSRAGTSLPFNGLDFGHAVRFGPNLDAATIARVESLIARNTPEVTL